MDTDIDFNLSTDGVHYPEDTEHEVTTCATSEQHNMQVNAEDQQRQRHVNHKLFYGNTLI